ncbi:MAG TPA: DUF1538 domain-containing protein [Methanoculleus sp.]|mgnify:CR=1 FL=1|nr:DUF1538 domain-containing protein [Methanomicrobiaceae archaeon]HDR73259.1 DUF1538 domain-containing protein [Methanoculleus sp.]
MIGPGILEGMDHIILDVLMALTPLVIFFVAFQLHSLKLPREYVVALFKGILITMVGMVLFFQGISIAFIPAGQEIGAYFGSLDRVWLLVPFGFFLGFLATYAEPAVRVLCDQIEHSSSGSVRGSLILYALSIGVAASVALGMARIIYGFAFLPILVGGYLLAIVLARCTDPDFVAIAFDSGGVATGPIAVTFLMSLAVGVAASFEGKNPLTEGFGLIALIALAPILSVLILGILFKRKKENRL